MLWNDVWRPNEYYYWTVILMVLETRSFGIVCVFAVADEIAILFGGRDKPVVEQQTAVSLLTKTGKVIVILILQCRLTCHLCNAAATTKECHTAIFQSDTIDRIIGLIIRGIGVVSVAVLTIHTSTAATKVCKTSTECHVRCNAIEASHMESKFSTYHQSIQTKYQIDRTE
jgi:hypothetical protein